MHPRELHFSSYDDIRRDIATLHAGSYRALRNWNLSQVCGHLAYFFHGSLEGFDQRLPWLIRKLIGRPLLHAILRSGKMSTRLPTLPAAVSPPDLDEAAAVNAALTLLARLAAHRGALQPSPIFGDLTVEEWRRLHMIHAAHHLRFLVPSEYAAHEPPP